MSAATVAFVGALAYAIPALRPVLQEHLDDQEGEVLPHLFMADVERWIHLEVVNRPKQSSDVVARVLEFLEEAYALGDPEVTELISVSFLEHLPRPGELGSEVHTMVGPHLRHQLRIIG
jgi:hypothetical protein